MNQPELSFTDTVRSAVRYAFTIGYCVRHNPHNASANWPERKSVKPPVVKTWFVNQNTMLDAVVEALPTFNAGTVKQLMAGTAAGKTTKLPLHIAKQLQMGVLVLVPRIGISQHVASYVQSIAEQQGMGGCVFELTTSMTKTVGKVPAVYYAAIGEFLAHLCANPELLRNLSIGLIILDESHVVRPEYAIIRRLIASGVFSDVKLLFASATASGAGDVSREDTSRREVYDMPTGTLASWSPLQHPVGSPFHYGAINNRVLMFVADDREFIPWMSYYTTHDVPCMAYGYTGRISEQSNIARFFYENPVCVVITTSTLETSYTFDFDRVLDLGTTVVMRWDLEHRKFALVKEHTPKDQAVQRAGRAGRINKGDVFQFKANKGLGVHETDKEVAQYVYLWSRMFNIQINDPSVSAFGKFFGGLTKECIGMLLTCAFPPAIALSYVADDGVFGGWEKGFRVLAGTNVPLPVSKSGNEEYVAKWATRSVASFDPELEGLMEYKSFMELSHPYDILACYLWMVYDGEACDQVSDAITMYGGNSIKRVESKKKRHVRALSSVIPAVPSIPEKFHRALTNHTVASFVPRPAKKQPMLEVASQDLSSEDEQVVELPRVVPVKEVVPQSVAVQQQYTYHMPTQANVAAVPEMIRDASSVRSWASASSANSDVVISSLRHVKHPKKHWRKLMYPYDVDDLQMFQSNLASSGVDVRRYNALVEGKKKFGSLSKDTDTLKERQSEYCFSVLRVHRLSLITMLQAAVGTKKRSNLLNLFGPEDEPSAKYAERAQNAAGLLEVMTTLGFKFGVDRRKEHSTTGYVPDMIKLATVARFALDNGPKVVQERLEVLNGLALPFVFRHSVERVFAQAWAINDVQFAPAHAYEMMQQSTIARWLTDAGEQLICDDDIVIFHHPGTVLYPWRKPRHKERVYLVKHDSVRGEIRAYGFSFTYVTSENFAYVECVLSKGYSGSLVVAASDGSIVGMYIGDTHSDDGVEYSRYVTATVMFSLT